VNCPTGCSTQLVMSERQGIEIDYCPTCRGVWLDRGELDKIIDRSHGTPAEAAAPAPTPAAAPAPPPPHPAQGWHEPHVDTRRFGSPGSPAPGYYPGSPPPGYGGGGYGKRKKKRGFLDDIFDF
jgi:Zn-finger nucleic acid-binding protein